ncbi:hypothetical protein EDM76_06585, partial [bacterium]
QADVVVVNHHLFCADLALREKIWEHTVGLPTLRLPSDKATAWCDRPKGTKIMPPGAKVQALDDITMSSWPSLPHPGPAGASPCFP